MSDTKLVSLSAGSLSSVSVPEVSVVTTTTTPQVSSSLPASELVVTNVQSTDINVIVSGMEEEIVPDARLFKFAAEKYKVSEEVLLEYYKLAYSATSSSLDIVALAVVKALQESQYTTDEINLLVSFERIFSDDVYSTDDFYGQANIDDDEYALVDKVLHDWYSVQDEAKLSFDKAPLLESQTAQDVTYLSPDKAALDSVEFTESAPIFEADKNTLEVVGTQEILNSDVELDKRDESTVLDTLGIDVETPAEDTASSTDEAYLDIEPVFEDNNLVAELVELEAEKVAEDASDTQDDLYAEVGINYEEIFGYYDDEVVKDVSTGFSEYEYFLSDYVEPDYLVHALHISEGITEFVIGKGLEDLIDATDDFYGAATIGDDEYASVNKVLVDYAQLLETIATQANYYRSGGENSFTADQAYITANKNLLETSVTQETVSSAFDTARQDSFIQQDVLAVQVGYVAADDASTTQDELALTVAPKLSDNYISADNAFTDVTANKQDNTSTSEAKSFVVETQILEIVDATDDFYGAATIGDDEYAAVNKVLADYGTVTEEIITVTDFQRTLLDSTINQDVLALEPNKLLQDSSNSSDTITMIEEKVLLEATSTSHVISLYRQSYFQQDYVAQEYLGEIYTY